MTYPNRAGTDTRPARRGRLSRRALAVLYPLVPAVLLVAVGGLWVRGEVQRHSGADLRRGTAMALQLKDVRAGIERARTAERAFVRSYPVRGIASAGFHASEALVEIEGARAELAGAAELDRKVGVDPDGALRRALDDRIGAFEAGLRRIMTLAERVGPDDPEMVAAQAHLDAVAGEIETVVARYLEAVQAAVPRGT